ncbi:MAG: TSUP family transporter, partial [Luteibaculum sp.]
MYLTRLLVIPAIPKIIFSSPFLLTKDGLIMLLFALIMLLAALAMLNSKKQIEPAKDLGKKRYIFIVLEGLLVGCITGFVGAGGGFLIIPALVLLAKLPMK